MDPKNADRMDKRYRMNEKNSFSLRSLRYLQPLCGLFPPGIFILLIL